MRQLASELSRKFPGTPPVLPGLSQRKSRTRPKRPQSGGNAMNRHHRTALAAIALLGMAHSASADVIVDWNTKAVDFIVSHKMPPPPAERLLAMTHAAMFDAVNSIEHKYRPYLVELPTSATASQEAAAATAAGTVLAGANPAAQPELNAAL